MEQGAEKGAGLTRWSIGMELVYTDIEEEGAEKGAGLTRWSIGMVL